MSTKHCPENRRTNKKKLKCADILKIRGGVTTASKRNKKLVSPKEPFDCAQDVCTPVADVKARVKSLIEFIKNFL